MSPARGRGKDPQSFTAAMMIPGTAQDLQLIVFGLCRTIENAGQRPADMLITITPATDISVDPPVHRINFLATPKLPVGR